MSPIRQCRRTSLMSYVAVSLGHCYICGRPRVQILSWTLPVSVELSRGLRQFLHVFTWNITAQHFVSIQIYVTNCFEMSPAFIAAHHLPFARARSLQCTPPSIFILSSDLCLDITSATFHWDFLPKPFMHFSSLLHHANFGVIRWSRYSEVKLWPWQCGSQAKLAEKAYISCQKHKSISTDHDLLGVSL